MAQSTIQTRTRGIWYDDGRPVVSAKRLGLRALSRVGIIMTSRWRQWSMDRPVADQPFLCRGPRIIAPLACHALQSALLI